MANSKVKRTLLISSALLLAGPGIPALGSGSAMAQERPIVIKMATLAPSDSPWHNIYKEMAARFAEVSDGRVTLTIFPGGVAGEEPDVIRKMKIGQLQAGGLSIAGLTHITSAVTALAIPFLMETPEDLAAVRKAVEPMLEEILAQEGYVVFNWGDAGWMSFFLPEPDVSLETVMKYRFVAWSDGNTLQLFEDAGFRHVFLNLNEVLPGLSQGLADAIGTTPLVVLSNQWFPFVPYMLDLAWAPLVGATIVDRRVWDRIPEDLRPRLMEAAREAGVRLQTEIFQAEKDAIAAMEERGVTVVEPTSEQKAEWRALFTSVYPKLRGGMIPEYIFDEALRVMEERRGG